VEAELLRAAGEHVTSFKDRRGAEPRPRVYGGAADLQPEPGERVRGFHGAAGQRRAEQHHHRAFLRRRSAVLQHDAAGDRLDGTVPPIIGAQLSPSDASPAVIDIVFG
jgi:hypothetical protein